MVGRPRTIFLAAFWFWISYSIAINRAVKQLASSIASMGDSAPVLLRQIAPVLPVLAAVLFVWGLVALIQARPKAILVLRVFLVMWTLLIFSRLYWLLSGSSRAMITVAVIVLINIAVVYMISRSEFRIACANFRNERDAAAMQRQAEKAMKRFGE